MIDFNIPQLRRLCLCNCDQNAKLADLQVLSLGVWKAEIEEIESHGYKQGAWDGVSRSAYTYADGSPVPEPDAMEELFGIVQAAREKAYRRRDALSIKMQEVARDCVPVDEWGVLIEDEAEHLRDFAVREDARRHFRENLRNKQRAGK